MVIKKHWLYGKLEFKIDVQKEDNCSECVHWKVCKRDMPSFCENYNFGTSDARNQDSCDTCIHRYTRWDKDESRIPCFKCKHFEKFINPSRRTK